MAAICEAAGTSIDQTVKVDAFLSDFVDLPTFFQAWADPFTDGLPASGFFEVPPRSHEIPACDISVDLVGAVPEDDDRHRAGAVRRAGQPSDGMRILWDVPSDDGNVLRADVFLPAEDGAYPTLLSYGPYAKGLAFQEGYPTAWETMASQHPDVVEGSTNAYQNWSRRPREVDASHGYAIVRVDSRGCGRSPGIVDHFSRETQDFHDCIEWAAAEPWSDGNVGLSGSPTSA